MSLKHNWLKTINLFVIIFYILLVNQKDYYDIESKMTRVVKMEKYCTTPCSQFTTRNNTLINDSSAILLCLPCIIFHEYMCGFLLFTEFWCFATRFSGCYKIWLSHRQNNIFLINDWSSIPCIICHKYADFSCLQNLCNKTFISNERYHQWIIWTILIIIFKPYQVIYLSTPQTRKSSKNLHWS